MIKVSYENFASRELVNPNHFSSDCVAVEGHKERAYSRDPDVPSEHGHLQKRRQLFGGVSKESAESRELRLRDLRVSVETREGRV